MFSPRMSDFGPDESYEEFDARFFDQRPGTWLEGLYQSARYFSEDAHKVRNWFRARPIDAEKIDVIMRTWPSPPASMAALHVRRGDYAYSSGVISGSGTGWLLPLSYYRDALNRIPTDAGLAVFSDDPDWAAEQFKDRKVWVSRGNSSAVDMMLMAKCRWVVTANSSFSWWAGWLNSHREKRIFAPEFHLGFRIGKWVPQGIAVDEWEYLTVAC
jgi:hypothetical protein